MSATAANAPTTSQRTSALFGDTPRSYGRHRQPVYCPWCRDTGQDLVDDEVRLRADLYGNAGY
jgi:hypothetical protein